SFVVVQEREHLCIGKLLAAIEEVELHHESHARDFGAQGFRQLDAGVSRAASGQQVVDNDHPLPRLDRIFVNLQRVDAILQLVTPFHRLGREFVGLADRNEAGIQAVGQRRTEDEATGLDGQYDIDLGVEIVLGESVDERGKTYFVLEQRGDVI